MEQNIKFPPIDLSKTKAVLIDLDNTLYHYDSCHAKAIKKCYSDYKKSFNHFASFTDFYNFYRQKRDGTTKRLSPTGACRSRLLTFQEMFEDLNIDSAWELAAKYDEIYWSNLIENITIAKDALEFLEKCKKLQISVCIVSDMIAGIQIRKLKKLGINNYVKYLVTSEEAGVEKPNSQIFKRALAKLDLESKEVIMIGDSEDKDIKGAQNLGIKSYKVFIKNI